MDAQQKSFAAIEKLKTDLAQAVSELPPALQSDNPDLLVDCLATVFDEGDSKQLPKKFRTDATAPPFWEVFAKALTENSDEEGQAELEAAETAAAHIEAEIQEAETSWEPIKDLNLCSGSVLAHKFLAHLHYCQVPSPAPSSVSGKPASKYGRAASVGAAGLARPRKRPRSVPPGKSNLSNASGLPRQVASSAACLPVKAEAGADLQSGQDPADHAPDLKFPVRNKRTEQPRKVRKIQELPWRSPETAQTGQAHALGMQQMSGHQREATVQERARMTHATAENPLQTAKPQYKATQQHLSSVQAIKYGPGAMTQRHGQQPFIYSHRLMSGADQGQPRPSLARSSSGNEAQNQMTHSRAQNLPPVYQAPAQRSTGLTVTGNPSLGLPRMSHQPTIKPAQPVNLRYSQASAQPPSAIATSRPASFYPSAGTPAARPQGSYSYPTNNPQQRVQTGGQPGIGGYESRPPLSNSSLCPSYPPVTTPGYPPVTTPSLPRQALGSQPAAQNGRPVYTQAPGYNISHSTGQQRPQAVNMAQNSSAIRPSTARSVPLHLERARTAALAASNKLPAVQFTGRPYLQNQEAPKFRVSDFSYPARPPLAQNPTSTQALYGLNSSASSQYTAPQLQSRAGGGQASHYGGSLRSGPGTRLGQSWNSMQEGQIPGLNGSYSQMHAPPQRLQVGPTLADSGTRCPASMQGRPLSSMTNPVSIQPLGGQTQRPGFGGQDAQGFESSIPGLGLPIEKPKVSLKETVMPKEVMLDTLDPEDSLLYTTPLNGYYREDWRLSSDDKEEWKSPRTQHVHS